MAVYADIAAALILGVLAFYDIKTRELPTKTTLLSIPLLLLLRIAEGVGSTILPLKIYIAVDAITLILLSLIAMAGMIGWGDVAAAAIIVAAAPAPTFRLKLFPPILTTIAYYAIIVAAASALNAAYNIVFNRRHLESLPTRYKILYMFMARPKRVEEFLTDKAKWWYPLSICGEYKLSFNIYLNPPDVKNLVLKAISKGCISRNDIVWSTYGVPAVPLLAASYILALLLGDEILLKPLLAVAHTG